MSASGTEARPSLEDVSDVAFRVCFTLIFIVAGLGHFFRMDLMLERLEASPFYELIVAYGSPVLMMQASGAALVCGGVALLLGYRTRLASLLLMATLVPITAGIHFAPDHTGPLLKNVALFGGLIHFAVRGPGAYSLEP